MLTNFGNLFITAPRHAEGTDARLDIRKHDPEQDSRRKKDQQNGNDALNTPDDSATVTVEALRIFLENFLKSAEPQDQDNPTLPFSDDINISKNITQAHPVNGETARAVGVYQHVAQKVERHHAPPMAQDAQATGLLQAKDLRIIHKLLDDLKPLSDHGVEYITIERGETFLGSLIAAVEKAKNS